MPRLPCLSTRPVSRPRECPTAHSEGPRRPAFGNPSPAVRTFLRHQLLRNDTTLYRRCPESTARRIVKPFLLNARRGKGSARNGKRALPLPCTRRRGQG